MIMRLSMVFGLLFTALLILLDSELRSVKSELLTDAKFIGT